MIRRCHGVANVGVSWVLTCKARDACLLSEWSKHKSKITTLHYMYMYHWISIQIALLGIRAARIMMPPHESGMHIARCRHYSIAKSTERRRVSLSLSEIEVLSSSALGGARA
jgi:hypothetical protein